MGTTQFMEHLISRRYVQLVSLNFKSETTAIELTKLKLINLNNNYY